jgi:hypothetical protein
LVVGKARFKEFCCERGSESAERLGVETDFRFRESRPVCAVFFCPWVNS